MRILQALLGTAHRRRRILGTKKSAARHLRRAVDRDITRQLRMNLAAKFHHPRSQRRMLHGPAHVITRMHDIGPLLVSTLRGIHRADHTHLVHDLRGLAEVMTNHQAIRLGRDRLGLAHDLLLLRLGIKSIHMAHAACHEQVNDMLRLALDGIRWCRRRNRGAQHRHQMHSQKGARRIRHEMTARQFVGFSKR